MCFVIVNFTDVDRHLNIYASVQAFEIPHVFFYLLERYNFLFNGALIKPGWVLTVANILQVKKGAKPIKPHKLRVVLGTFNFRNFFQKLQAMKFIKTFLLQNNKNNNNNNKLQSKWYLGCERFWAMVFFFSTFRLPQTLCSSYSTIYFFYIGEFNRNKLDGTETPIRVKRIVIHPGYDRYSMAHNIALLELENPVKLNDHIRMVSWRVVAIISRSFLLLLLGLTRILGMGKAQN